MWYKGSIPTKQESGCFASKKTQEGKIEDIKVLYLSNVSGKWKTVQKKYV